MTVLSHYLELQLALLDKITYRNVGVIVARDFLSDSLFWHIFLLNLVRLQLTHNFANTTVT